VLYQLSYRRVGAESSAGRRGAETLALWFWTLVKRLLAPIPIAVICAVLALVALLAYGISSNKPDRSVEGALARGEREQAPALTLPKLSGSGTVDLAAYRGKVVVLNYWASWCRPCREESPLLERWHKRIAKQGGTVLGVNANDVDYKARAFVREYALSYPQLRDKASTSVGKLGIVGFPETFVIDRRGYIAAVQRGPVTEGFMRGAVERVLAEDA
jgi:cytochrome c biogenesis protein CcmG, thiol:disulfide interchange protein DsbE